MDIVEQARQTRLALTVTSGRSGAKLLTALLADALQLAAEHEPAPRANFVMRSFVEAPGAADPWLRTEKLPAMLASARNGFYAETSHLFCKGLIEPMLAMGIHPALIILTRPAREVASSLCQMNVIPARTEAGRLVLLGPGDPGVLPLPDWRLYSDYQLCFWYAREIERRQAHYDVLGERIGLSRLLVVMRKLRTPETLAQLAQFLGATADDLAFARQAGIVEQNQNSRRAATGSTEDRPLPPDLDNEEAAVDAAISAACG
jgi:hypothetical protein